MRHGDHEIYNQSLGSPDFRFNSFWDLGINLNQRTELPNWLQILSLSRLYRNMLGGNVGCGRSAVTWKCSTPTGHTMKENNNLKILKKSMAGRNPTFPIKLISVSKAIIQEPCVHVLLYQLFSVKLGMEDPIALLTLRTGTTYSAWQGESATKILHNGSHGRFQVILRESQAIWNHRVEVDSGVIEGKYGRKTGFCHPNRGF